MINLTEEVGKTIKKCSELPSHEGCKVSLNKKDDFSWEVLEVDPLTW